MLDDFVRTEGNPEVVQFSGGEPTIHPQIIDFVRAAKARSIRFVMLNTNGKRIAHDDRFLEELDEVRPAFYFQFDGFESRDLPHHPRRAGHPEGEAARARPAGGDRLHVTLVPAIERGVNEHEIGRIVDFAIKHPAVRGINFQPAFHAGRHMPHDPMQRMTIPDIVALIEAQTSGKFVASDFVPVPCCFPDLQFGDLRVCRRRAGHAAPAHCQCRRLSRLHHQPRRAGLQPRDQDGARRAVVVLLGRGIGKVAASSSRSPARPAACPTA